MPDTSRPNRTTVDPMNSWVPITDWPLSYPSETALRRRIDRARAAGIRIEWARRVGRRVFVHAGKFMAAIEAAPSASEPPTDAPAAP
jgi:hypothetical protein